MPTIRMAIASGVLVLAASLALASCKQPAPTAPAVTTKPAAVAPKATVEHKGDDSEAVEFEASCDQNNHAYDVKPATKKAKTAAEKMCQNTGKAIDEAPWPSGLSPVPMTAKTK